MKHIIIKPKNWYEKMSPSTNSSSFDNYDAELFSKELDDYIWEQPRADSDKADDVFQPPNSREVYELQLSEDIFLFYLKTTQSLDMVKQKMEMRDHLFQFIRQIFPLCGLYVIGSSLNGFGSNNADMDLCLMLSSFELDQKTDSVPILRAVKDVLENLDFVTDQQLIETAKVPILRIMVKHKDNKTMQLDLNVNNSVGIKNTHLLYYYSNYDFRIRPLVAIIKEWARRRGINDSARSSFTSYSLVLMVIHYLQYGVEPPILPSLQQRYKKHFDDTSDVRQLKMNDLLNDCADLKWEPKNGMNLAKLLIGFFEYYSYRFNYENCAISIRMGRTLNREEVMVGQELSSWACIWIEEPFTRLNTAHSVYNTMIFDMIKQTFIDSFEFLNSNLDLNAFLNAPSIPLLGLHRSYTSSGLNLNDMNTQAGADPSKE